MKFKRTVTIITALCLMLVLAGCSLRVSINGKAPDADVDIMDLADVPPEDETAKGEDADGEDVGANEGANVQPPASPYDEIIAQYRKAVTDGYTTGDMLEAGLNYMIPDCLAYDERAHVGYFTADITGNGEDELLIAAASESEYYTGMVFAVYELVGDKPVLMLETGERNCWYWAGEHRLLNIGSSGAANSGTYLCDTASDMGFVEAVEYNGDEYPDDPWLIFNGETWSHTDDDTAAAKELELRSAVTNPPINEF